MRSVSSAGRGYQYQMSKNKVDIFQALNNLSKKNSAFYDQLSEQEQKSLQPVVVMRWLSGTSNARQVFFLNEFVNTKVFSLYRHPKLLCQLMTVCTTGQSQRYHWNKVQKGKSVSMPNANAVIRQYFGYSSSEAEQALPLLDNDDIVQYAEHLGWQSDDIKGLNKELRARSKNATAT